MQGFYVLPPILIGRFFTTVDIDDGSLIVPTIGSFVYFVVDLAIDLLLHSIYKLCYNCVRIEHKGVYNDCNDNSKS